VKVVVGGAAVTEDYAKSIGADGYGEDAVKAVKVCKELLGIKE
jgi:5-methyltetrahydrofolate--homocysteine methyltransferase